MIDGVSKLLQLHDVDWKFKIMPILCPKCQSNNISPARQFDFGIYPVSGDLSCRNCSFEWTEEFKISHMVQKINGETIIRNTDPEKPNRNCAKCDYQDVENQIEKSEIGIDIAWIAVLCPKCNAEYEENYYLSKVCDKNGKDIVNYFIILQDKYLEENCYGIPQTYLNKNKVIVGSMVIIVGKNKGTRNLLRKYGIVKSVKYFDGEYKGKPSVIKWIYWNGSSKNLIGNMSEEVWQKIKNLPGFNDQLAIRVINKEIFDQIVKEGSQQEIDDVPEKAREMIETDVIESSQQEIEEIIEQVKRRRIETARLERNPKFTHQIMEVYNHQCAICGIQIGIVEAAHIWEVSDGGTDEISNGIALCPNHHDAFDMNLITFDTQYQLNLNAARVLQLRESKWNSGLDELLSDKKLRLPTDERHWPKKEYIERRLAYFKSKQ